MQYNPQRRVLGHAVPKNSKACSFFLLIHSTETRKRVIMKGMITTGRFGISGVSNSEKDKIF
jgi:hypothetical protein